MDAVAINQVLEFIASAAPSSDIRKVPAELRDGVGHAVADLFRELQSLPEAQKLFGEQSGLEARGDEDVRHWRALLEAPLDEQFAQRALLIGKAHAERGVASFWQSASYAWLIARCIPQLTRRYPFNRSQINRALQALVLRAFADLILASAAYHRDILEEKGMDHEDETSLQSLKNLAATVADVNEVAFELAHLSKNTRDVCSSAQTISSAAVELVASVEEIARNSEGAADDATAADHTVTSGRSAVGQVSTAIRNIATAVEETAASVDELTRASEQIGQILAVIENIAEQTNLLALNATIEAARAGQAGRGFAVVASEVKGLATQTSKSTDDIAQRIASLRNGMNAILSTMQRSKSAVQDGQMAIADAASTMDRIADQVANVSTKLQGISSILRQQKGASAEIAQSIDHVAQTAAANEGLLGGMAAKLRQSNDRFSEDAKNWFRIDSHRALCEMAKIDHVLFKKRVVDAVMGQNQWKASEVPDHHHCRLGKWYDAVALPQIKSLPAFARLLEPHRRVHAAAKAALTAHAAEDMSAALGALTELNDASHEVLAVLDELSSALHGDLVHFDRRKHRRQTMQRTLAG